MGTVDTEMRKKVIAQQQLLHQKAVMEATAKSTMKGKKLGNTLKTRKSKGLGFIDMEGLDIADGKVLEYKNVPGTEREVDAEKVKLDLNAGLANMMKNINIKKESEKTEKIINEYQANLNKVTVKTGCFWDFYRLIARNVSCIIYMTIVIITILAIVF